MWTFDLDIASSFLAYHNLTDIFFILIDYNLVDKLSPFLKSMKSQIKKRSKNWIQEQDEFALIIWINS